PDGVFRSFPGGLSELVRAVTDALPPSSIRVGAGATRVIREPLSVEMLDGSPCRGRALILTSPAYVTADLVRDVDADLARLCNEIPYASSGTVALAFPRAAVAHPLNGSGYVVPRVERNGIMAASWLSSKWPHRVPE